ncbi:hypothetical protein BH23VER1_BH23VER1_36410 [soil metagenome]
MLAQGEAGADADTICIHQANILYEAIKAYEAREGKLPDLLGDLAPHYLTNGSLLVCPVARETGDYSIGQKGLRDPFALDVKPTYVYEFYLDPKAKEDPGHPTSRQFKELARKTVVGDKVPILTCLNHPRGSGKRICVAYDGTVYRSDGYWESAFRDLMPFPYLGYQLLVQDQRHPRERVIPRSLEAPDHCLDLSEHYNAMPADPWLHGTNDTLSAFAADHPTGLCTVGEITFDARALVQLNGRTTKSRETGFQHPSYPDSAGPVVVGRTVKALHFLHAAAFPPSSRTVIGTYSIHYGGGSQPFRQSVPIRIRIGHEVDVWSSDGPPRVAPAWESQADSGHALRLFVTRWENPHPETTVKSITLETNPESAGAPFVLAITTE